MGTGDADPAGVAVDEAGSAPRATGHAGTTGAGPYRGRVRERLPSGLLFSLAVYLASRVPVLVTVAVYLARTPSKTVGTIVDERDGWWYTLIARSGYTSSLRQPVAELGDPHHKYSAWGFFPGYPLVIRAVHEVTRLPYATAALVVAAVCGFLAVWAVHGLGVAFADERVGRGAALLVAFSPGSASFTWPYSDGLFVAAAAAGLTALHRRQWLLAGLCGAAATLTRPTGVALVAAAAAAALVELVRRRDPRPLVAPLVAASGGLAFALFGWWRTGDPYVWRHAENLWRQRLDFGHDLRALVQPLLADPAKAWQTHDGSVYLVMAYVDILGLLLLVLLVAAAVAQRRRLTAPMIVYAAVTVFTIVGYSAVAPRPRMILAVVPGFVWLAATLPRRATVALAALFVPLLVAVTVTWLWGVTP